MKEMGMAWNKIQRGTKQRAVHTEISLQPVADDTLGQFLRVS